MVIIISGVVVVIIIGLGIGVSIKLEFNKPHVRFFSIITRSSTTFFPVILEYFATRLSM